MKRPLLSISGISKAYRDYGSEWRRIASWFGLKSQTIKENWTLRDISFTLEAGDAIGIVGQNGAGKSTLLKIIVGTLKPTSGTCIINGRIAAILELGMGFHPDLTGRENAYHSAGLMGFTKEQIDAAIDHIEAFAEIGHYFDQPVRLYSSGMQVRVAFAVATAYRPEILIVDEALSVGDTYFQHKSFERIRHFQEHGTSLLLVSHDSNAIQSICSRAILLNEGRILQDGKPEAIFDFYNALIAQKENTQLKQIDLEDGKKQTISGTAQANIKSVVLHDIDGNEVKTIGVGDSVILKVNVSVCEDLPSLVLGYSIKNRLGQVLYGTNTWHTGQVIYHPTKGQAYLFSIVFNANFGVGSYSVQLALVDQDTHLTQNYEWRDLALMFDVINVDKQFFIGSLWSEPKIKVENL